jgi:hypothetical protein
MTVTETEISLLHGLRFNESLPSSDYGSLAAVKQALLPNGLLDLVIPPHCNAKATSKCALLEILTPLSFDLLDIPHTLLLSSPPPVT